MRRHRRASPLADGKHRTCNAFRLFMARWARRLSWSEVAEIFGTNWGVVHRAVRWVVDWGLAHRDLDGVKAIGVDEIAVWKGHKYLTVVYQIDQGLRPPAVGRSRTDRGGLPRILPDPSAKVRAENCQFVASDMWKPYIKLIAEFAGQAIHVLDRFHIVAKVNKAVDDCARLGGAQLRRDGYEPILKHTRWCFLKRPENLTDTQHDKLTDVLRYNLRSVRAYLLKESLDAFWQYDSALWASWFLDKWCTRALRSPIGADEEIARTLRSHHDLILNWVHCQKGDLLGAVEGMNTNAKLAIRKARGFRTYEALETALYHQLGHLPEPAFLTHRIC